MHPAHRIIALVVLLAAAPIAAQDQSYHERLEFDPVTGEWVEIAPPVPGTEGGDLSLARSLLARGEYEAAREAFEHWFETYPDSDQYPEALFYAAETEIMMADAQPRTGDLIQAHGWLKELLDGWPGTELYERAMRKELIVAEMFLMKGARQRVLGGLLWLSAEEEALQILDALIDDYGRDAPIGEQALRIKADYHYANGEFEEAELAYSRLMRDYPRGRYGKIALLRSGQSALARFPGIHFDDADLLESYVYLKDFLEQYPQSAAENNVPQLLNRIRDSRAEKAYRVGRFYERVDQIDAAAYYYRYVTTAFEGTIWAARARDRLIGMGAIAPDSQRLEEEMYEPDDEAYNTLFEDEPVARADGVASDAADDE